MKNLYRVKTCCALLGEINTKKQRELLDKIKIKPATYNMDGDLEQILRIQLRNTLCVFAKYLSSENKTKYEDEYNKLNQEYVLNGKPSPNLNK